MEKFLGPTKSTKNNERKDFVDQKIPDFLRYIKDAEKIIRTADHLIYVTFPLIKDKRILLILISELKKAVASCINAILQYDYLYQRISLYQDAKINFETFKNKSSKRFDITNQEIALILKLFDLEQNHKKSSMEFTKDNKLIILSEDMRQRIITLEEIKQFLQLSKDVLKKTKNIILGKI